MTEQKKRVRADKNRTMPDGSVERFCPRCPPPGYRPLAMFNPRKPRAAVKTPRALQYQAYCNECSAKVYREIRNRRAPEASA